MQMKVAPALKQLVSDKNADQILSNLPDYFDLNHQTLVRTRGVLTEMDLHLDKFPNSEEARKIIFKAIAGAVINLQGFETMKVYFSENGVDSNSQDLTLKTVATVSGLAIGFRYSISGFLESKAKCADLFLQKIRNMKDSTIGISTKSSSSIKKFAEDSIFVARGEFGKFNTLVTTISESVAVVGVTYVAASFIDFADPTLKSLVPFLIASTSYLLFKKYMLPKKAETKMIDKIVNTKGRIFLMNTNIDVKLEK